VPLIDKQFRWFLETWLEAVCFLDLAIAARWGAEGAEGGRGGRLSEPSS